MFEKVNPAHPDKVADRIAGALVDYAYSKEDDPRIAVEVLLGHGECLIVAETSVSIPQEFVRTTVSRIAGKPFQIRYKEVPQDALLAANQNAKPKCGDNGIFKGVPITYEQKKLTRIAHKIYDKYLSDGKYILSNKHFVICQSNATNEEIQPIIAFEGDEYPTINPLGEWTGGTDVDTGATNRKLGSDMGDAVTGGGIHGKDCSKADVSVNIFCHMFAQIQGAPITAFCAIGDDTVRIGQESVQYSTIVDVAKAYIKSIGGFEKLAEWGLIR